MQLNSIKVKLDEKRIYKLISLMKPIVKNVEKPKWWGNNRSEFEIKIAKKYNSKDIFYEWNSNKLGELITLIPNKIYEHFKVFIIIYIFQFQFFNCSRNLTIQ